MNPVLGNIHRVTQGCPDLARRIACGESISGRKTELVQHHIAHEGATKVLAELGRDREGEFGMLHPFSVTGLQVAVWRLIGIFAELALRLRRLPRPADGNDDSYNH